MSTPSELIATAERLLASVSPMPLGALDDDGLVAHAGEIERVGRLVDALRAAAAGEIDHRSRRSLGPEGLATRFGCRRSAHLIERIARVSQSEAARRIRIGRELRGSSALDGSPIPPRFARVAHAVAVGAVGLDSALVITVNLGKAARVASLEQLDAGERRLVELAQTTSADLLAVEAVVWRTVLDADGVQPNHELLREQRRFTIGRENVDGLVPFSGLAEPVFAATLRAAIGERTSPTRRPRFLDPADVRDDEGAWRGDGRTPEQRAYDVLEGLLTAGIRSDAVVRGPLHSTATVDVVVRASDLDAQRGPAWLADVREPISAALAAEVACSGGARVVAVGPAGQPLWIGRRERLFTAAQRAALAVRDGGCIMPGCGAPPSWSHAHHVVPWSRGGPTDIDNGVLLCSHCHHLVHRGDYELRMVDGRPQLRQPRWVDPERRWVPVGDTRWQRAA